MNEIVIHKNTFMQCLFNKIEKKLSIGFQEQSISNPHNAPKMIISKKNIHFFTKKSQSILKYFITIAGINPLNYPELNQINNDPMKISINNYFSYLNVY